MSHVLQEIHDSDIEKSGDPYEPHENHMNVISVNNKNKRNLVHELDRDVENRVSTSAQGYNNSPVIEEEHIGKFYAVYWPKPKCLLGQIIKGIF